MNDDELRQALATLDAYKMQLDSMAQQSKIFQISLEETMRARDTLKAYSEAKEGDEILIPAGASSFVVAKIASTEKAIVGIGNKLSVDMDLSEAAKYMADSVVEISEAIKQLSAAMKDTETKAVALQSTIQQEYQRRQQ